MTTSQLPLPAVMPAPAPSTAPVVGDTAAVRLTIIHESGEKSVIERRGAPGVGASILAARDFGGAMEPAAVEFVSTGGWFRCRFEDGLAVDHAVALEGLVWRWP